MRKPPRLSDYISKVHPSWLIIVVSPNGTVISNNNYPLKKVFYGMAYVPLNAQLPNCYNTQQTVDEELQMVAQTTTRVRLYGTDCNVLRFTLDSIQRLKLDLKVVVGIWIDKDNATYTRQTTEFYSVVGTYGWSNIIVFQSVTRSFSTNTRPCLCSCPTLLRSRPRWWPWVSPPFPYSPLISRRPTSPH